MVVKGIKGHESRSDGNYRDSPEGGFWAICPEFPEANGQGKSIEETKESFKQAIELMG